MSLYVTQEVAEKYATKEWTDDDIKGQHDWHTHLNHVGYVTTYKPCPDCTVCRCPVPLEEHAGVAT